ncbi:3115_t:CDS:2 [Scutellospora calospora]|uniref:3115_t:CDS:1 n=1 Tax=Scutellospora calospora TaxID=85575 RepID=A0ACA9LNJ6_9GLOM|nr:3115_t:CDS:2 [Scutellospora calospora]
MNLIKQYGLSQGFTIRYNKVDNRNKEKEIRKRTILCSRKGTPVAKKDDNKPKQQRESKRYNVKERVLLLRRAGCDVSQILFILKEEFSEEITWIYNDIYNFIYRTQELNNEKFDASKFIQILKLMQEENPEFKFSYMNSLKNDYPKAVAYLVQMEKTVDK